MKITNTFTSWFSWVPPIGHSFMHNALSRRGPKSSKVRESILWVGFKLTNKLHNFHYYYNILKSLQPCVSGWWGWKNGSEMRILAAKFNAKMRTDTSFLKLITTLPLLRVFKETWQGSRTLRYRGCIEKKEMLWKYVHMYMAKRECRKWSTSENDQHG